MERMPRRTTEREKRLGPKIAGDAPDHPARPAVDRIGPAVPFRLRGKMRPEAWFGRADQEKRPGPGRQAGVLWSDGKAADHGQPFIRQPGL
jgi:hypothetical protein